MTRRFNTGFYSAILLGAAVTSSLLAATPSQTPEEQGFQKRDNVHELCELILKSVNALPADAGVTDIEAAIVYAISQAPMLQSGIDEAQRKRIIDGALSCALGDGSRRNLVLAIGNVRNSYGIGTGAVQTGSSGGGNGGFGGSFSPPLVGIGGGSSNYSTDQ